MVRFSLLVLVVDIEATPASAAKSALRAAILTPAIVAFIAETLAADSVGRPAPSLRVWTDTFAVDPSSAASAARTRSTSVRTDRTFDEMFAWVDGGS